MNCASVSVWVWTAMRLALAVTLCAGGLGGVPACAGTPDDPASYDSEWQRAPYPRTPASGPTTPLVPQVPYNDTNPYGPNAPHLPSATSRPASWPGSSAKTKSAGPGDTIISSVRTGRLFCRTMIPRETRGDHHGEQPMRQDGILRHRRTPTPDRGTNLRRACRTPSGTA